MSDERPPGRAPVHPPDGDEATRRQFMGLLTLASGGLFAGTVALGAAGARRDAAAPPHRIGSLEGLPAVSTFHFPDGGEPCLLIRVGTTGVVAYQQACTHLGCPLTYQPGARVLHCPCHEGYFALEDGRPVAGPPRHPLRKIALTLRDGAVWATGIESS